MTTIRHQYASVLTTVTCILLCISINKHYGNSVIYSTNGNHSLTRPMCGSNPQKEPNIWGWMNIHLPITSQLFCCEEKGIPCFDICSPGKTPEADERRTTVRTVRVSQSQRGIKHPGQLVALEASASICRMKTKIGIVKTKPFFIDHVPWETSRFELFNTSR